MSSSISDLTNYINTNSAAQSKSSITGSGNLGSSDRTPTSELDKDAFLKILIMQLANQDPLEPMSDTEFIAQMAQFSSLEQMQTLNKTFEASQAQNMIGKTVIATTNIQNEEGNYVETELVGIVSGTVLIDGETYLAIGEYLVSPKSVSEIYDTTNVQNNIISGSNMVGKYIKAYYGSDNEEIVGKVDSIVIKGGSVYAIVGEKEIAVTNINKISNDPIELEENPDENSDEDTQIQ